MDAAIPRRGTREQGAAMPEALNTGAALVLILAAGSIKKINSLLGFHISK